VGGGSGFGFSGRKIVIVVVRVREGIGITIFILVVRRRVFPPFFLFLFCRFPTLDSGSDLRNRDGWFHGWNRGVCDRRDGL
jgi:hypothetical protein